MAPALAQDTASFFGHAEKEAGGLIAIIYDFKQTQARQPSQVTPETYPGIVKSFLQQGWDEQVLNRYFRITRPLYSTQIFIPRIDASAAPKAYGVEQVIKPSLWVIHYKGQVSPPEDGAYRFVGYADDVLAVAVNNKTVCVGGRVDMHLDSIWKSSEKPGAFAFNGNLTYGDWLPLKKEQPIDLDVLVGERPGGDFCAFLLYQKKGEQYAADKQGNPILPVFQLAPQPIAVKEPDKAAPFAVATAPWQQHH
ncbi:MAG: hypothetical protein QOE70_633 [Chthoniobacter sp.]|nr:hypothetical protein [Chthoniobacter sp.]